MKIDINVFPWHKTEPVDCGYIDMERFDAENVLNCVIGSIGRKKNQKNCIQK